MAATEPTIVTIPCFTGAQWTSRQLAPFGDRRVTTMRLPEDIDDVESYANVVASQVANLDAYVLVGDSFGAVIALTLAIRQPKGLVGLVLSGGFAANPLPRWKRVAVRASRIALGPAYRQGTLRFHAHQLASQFDTDGENPLNTNDFRQIFLDNTPHRSYVARVRSVLNFDVRHQLHRVNVPTLLLTPQTDTLVGNAAVADLLAGIPDVR